MWWASSNGDFFVILFLRLGLVKLEERIPYRTPRRFICILWLKTRPKMPAFWRQHLRTHIPARKKGKQSRYKTTPCVSCCWHPVPFYTARVQVSRALLLPSHNIWNGINGVFITAKLYATRMWANAQHDGRTAEYRWRPLFNVAKFGWHPLLECHAVMLPGREIRWN